MELDGSAIEVDTRKAIALLAYLAVEGEPKRRDSLAALLWPESDSSHARAALRRTLSALNKALGGEWLQIERESIGLDRKNGFRLDIDEFHKLLSSVEDHGHDWTDVCVRCEEPLARAISLYRQEFLAGFTLRDSPNFDDWQLFQAETVQRELARALDRIILIHIRAGQYEQAINRTRRRLALDRLHEGTHRTLMKLYAWSNQRTAAMRQYRECVRTLDQELKVPPLEETTELYNLIKADNLDPPEIERVGQLESMVVSPIELQGESQRERLPMVGREDEWGALTECYISSSSQGCFVLIEGETGIGKTRLIEEFLSHVTREGAVVLSSACYEGESNLAFGPFVEALHKALNANDSRAKLKDISPHHLAETSRLLPELKDISPELPEPPPLDSPGGQARFFEGVRRVILSLTQADHPGVLFLDDLHFADEATLDLLTFVVRRSSEDGLCVIGSFRSEELPSDHRLRLLAAEQQRNGAASLITIRRLEPDETYELLGLIGLPIEGIPDGLRARLHRETEGIPYFVNEYLTMIHAAIESGQEVDWTVPESARSILRSKLKNVTGGAMQLLTAAAVIGRPFDFEMIRQVSGRGEEESIEMLEELQGRLLIEELTPSEREEGSYLFQHEKLRLLVYDDTSQARRRLLHRRTADALRHRDGDALAGQVAYHYQRAGMETEAGEYFVRSGDFARSLYANREALDHYTTALELGHPTPATLLEKIGDLKTLLGEYREAIESFESAAAYGQDIDRSRYERKLGLVYHRRGDWDMAERQFEASLAARTDDSQAEHQALLFSDWALSVFKRGDLDGARELAGRALDLATSSGDSSAIAQSHNIMGILARHQGDQKGAKEHLQASISIAEEMENEAAQVAALNNLALVLADEGNFEHGLEATRKALDLSVARGDRHREAALHNNLADLLQASGRTEEALVHVKKSVEIYAEIGVDADEYQPEVWKLVEW
jgi:tetratricopeptide (TPR) repeat protein